MSRIRAILFPFWLLMLGTFLSTSYTECVTLTTANFHEVPHPIISSFSRNGDGVWTGTTIDGKSFTQYPVPNTYGLRIERFEIDNYSHYVVEGDIIYSLQDLSVVLALSQEKPHV